MKSRKLLSVGSLILIIVAAVACGGEQQDEPPEQTPAPTPTGTPTPQVVHLGEDFYFKVYIINTGDTDSLAFGWEGGPPDVIEWQYRVYPYSQFVREWVGRELGGWVTVPVNERETHVHEITALEAGWEYLIKLRPVVEGGVGEAANLYGYVPHPDEYPPIGEFNPPSEGRKTAIGDGHTQWLVHTGYRSRGLFLMTIPIGLWVSVRYIGELSEVWITEMNTLNYLVLSREGRELRRGFSELDPCYGVADRLYEIVASVRAPPGRLGLMEPVTGGSPREKDEGNQTPAAYVLNQCDGSRGFSDRTFRDRLRRQPRAFCTAPGWLRPPNRVWPLTAACATSASSPPPSTPRPLT